MPLQAGLTQNLTPEMYKPWSLVSQPEILLHDDSSSWAAEFSDAPQNYSSDPPAQQGISTSFPGNFTVIILVNFYSHSPVHQRCYPPQLHGNPMQMGMYGMGISNFQHANYSAITSFSKGKAKEIDFEAAFSQLAESVVSPSERASVIGTADETTKELEKALTNVSLNGNEDQADDGAHGYVASGWKGNTLNIVP